MLLIFPFQQSLQTAPKVILFFWGPEPNDHSVVSSLVLVKVFQRHCTCVFWSKILWKQYWYIASKEMYGKTTRAWTDCLYGNLDFIQKMTAALGAFILWWWSQDTSKCLPNIYKGLISCILITCFCSFSVSKLARAYHRRLSWPQGRFTTTKMLTKTRISLCLLHHESALA